jgi:CRP-like cAMP-binding protein
MKSTSQGGRSQGRGVSSLQLALLSRSVFDIPPRTRRLITVAGVAAIVVIAMGSLVGGSDHTIKLDKTLHFLGYAMLAGLFVLGLRPVLFVPALLTLVGLGFLLEYLQSFTGRSMDVADGVANSLGIAVGGSAGLLIRGAYFYVRRELAVLHVRRNLMHFQPGGLILREGSRVRDLYVIKSGKVRLSRTAGDKQVELGVAAAGDVVGTLGVLLDAPQFATIEAVSPTSIYRLEITQLMDSAYGHEQPVFAVLRSLAESLRRLAERAIKTEVRLDELMLVTEGHHDARIDHVTERQN